MQLRKARLYLIAAFVLFASAILIVGLRTLNAQDAQSQLSEERIEEIVRAYLLEHPEIVVEALNKFAERRDALRSQEMRAEARRVLPLLLSDSGGFAYGASEEDARVTVIEFFDYHCRYCKTVAGDLLDEVRERDDVRVVFKEFPILSEDSLKAAKVALEARKQNRYVDLHQAFMASPGRINAGRIEKIAKDLKLNPEPLLAAAQGREHDAALRETYELAQRIGVDATPGFVVIVGDQIDVFTGADFPRLKRIIETGEIAG